MTAKHPEGMICWRAVQRSLGAMKVETAVDSIWGLLCAHGELSPIVDGLYAKRIAHAGATLDALLSDLENPDDIPEIETGVQ